MFRKDNIIQSLKGKKVLIVGDLMVDKYLYGQVNRISPEAPVPIIDHKRTEYRLGGAANVALNIKMLDSVPILLGVVGEDEDGQKIHQALIDQGISSDFIVHSASRRTTIKTRVLGNNQQLLRVDSEDLHDLTENEFVELKSTFQAVLESEVIDLVILQDYDKGILCQKSIEYLINESNQRNIPIAVDPKFKDFFAYQKVNFFKPNLKEIQQALGIMINPTIDSLDEATKILRTKMTLGRLCITLGAHGIYINDGNSGVLIPTETKNVIDVCGAGDAVLSVASLMSAEGLGDKDIGLVSNIVGGIVCNKIGVAPVRIAEVEKELMHSIK